MRREQNRTPQAKSLASFVGSAIAHFYDSPHRRAPHSAQISEVVHVSIEVFHVVDCVAGGFLKIVHVED
jgi:hypothetical protein